ncbi:MAG TPA: ferritin-like domain-containing protein [Terriglobales bacterium]|nr:ferritin-like domain-containing protein [Terriglobales bacterium]
MSSKIPVPSSASDLQPWQELSGYATPMDIAWNFSYAIDDQKLKNLYSKAKQNQWDAETELDWSIEIDPSMPIVGEDRFPFLRVPFFQKLSKPTRETFVAHATCQLLSQFLHGEQGALMTAAAVTHAAPDYEAKLYSATQTVDEARHVEVYDAYIKKLGLVYPISPWLKEVIDATLQSGSFAKTMVGMNMLVEGLALAAFHNMRRQASCPLLRSLTEYVLRDEARHVAFGNVYLRSTIKDMHPDDREDVAQFAFDAVKLMADATGGVDGKGIPAPDPGFLQVLERSGIGLEDFINGMMEAGGAGFAAHLPPGHIHAFRDLMMPALVRVGAVTERTRQLYQAAGIPVWDNLQVLESMEEDAAGEVAIPEYA